MVEISRLVKIARTSDRPSNALLAEMKPLEDEQAAVLERTTTLQKRLDAVQVQVGSVEDSNATGGERQDTTFTDTTTTFTDTNAVGAGSFFYRVGVQE